MFLYIFNLIACPVNKTECIDENGIDICKADESEEDKNKETKQEESIDSYKEKRDDRAPKY